MAGKNVPNVFIYSWTRLGRFISCQGPEGIALISIPPVDPTGRAHRECTKAHPMEAVIFRGYTTAVAEPRLHNGKPVTGTVRITPMPKPSEDKRLTRLTRIALALPEAARQIYGSHAQFLVRKKTFAYFLDDHHGDGIVAVTCKVLPGDNKALAESQPRRFYLPAYIASKGWVALRLDVGKVDWDEVKELLLGSYALVAPKRWPNKCRTTRLE